MFENHRDCKLFYGVEGQGPPVILIQGVGLHGEGWRPQINALSGSYTCLWFDNRGMCKSQPVGERLTVELMTDDVLALMDRQGWESAHIIGHSLGGLIAQHLAITEPSRVRSLSLLCTISKGRDATRMSWWMLAIGMRTRLGTARSRRHAFLEIVMPPSALIDADRDALCEELHPLFGHDLASQPPVVMKQLGALRAYDATPRLAQLAPIPTLVVSAEQDRIAPPEYGRAIAAAIPGARYVELSDAAHGVTIHSAERINELLLEHLDIVESR